MPDDCDTHESIISACKELSGEDMRALLSAALGVSPGLEMLVAFEENTEKIPDTAAGKEIDRPGQTQSIPQAMHDPFLASKRYPEGQQPCTAVHSHAVFAASAVNGGGQMRGVQSPSVDGSLTPTGCVPVGHFENVLKH